MRKILHTISLNRERVASDYHLLQSLFYINVFSSSHSPYIVSLYIYLSRKISLYIEIVVAEAAGNVRRLGNMHQLFRLCHGIDPFPLQLPDPVLYCGKLDVV